MIIFVNILKVYQTTWIVIYFSKGEICFPRIATICKIYELYLVRNIQRFFVSSFSSRFKLPEFDCTRHLLSPSTRRVIVRRRFQRKPDALRWQITVRSFLLFLLWIVHRIVVVPSSNHLREDCNSARKLQWLDALHIDLHIVPLWYSIFINYVTFDPTNMHVGTLFPFAINFHEYQYYKQFIIPINATFSS